LTRGGERQPPRTPGETKPEVDQNEEVLTTKGWRNEPHQALEEDLTARAEVMKQIEEKGEQGKIRQKHPLNKRLQGFPRLSASLGGQK